MIKRSDFIQLNQVDFKFSSLNSWVILSSTEQSIKSKVEAFGTPLKDWDLNIYRGILTGYNEAFIISGQKRNELISKDPKSAEIIRPILRGRDIKKYHCDFADLWLIISHNGIREKGIKPIVIEDYPAVKEHLDCFINELKKRQDKGITPYNLRNCAYTDDFYKQKIIYPEITKFLAFFEDSGEYFTNNKCFILTTKHTAFLTAFFNSSLFKYCFINNFPELLGGTREIRKVFMEAIPVIKVTDETDTMFRKLLEEIKSLKAAKKPTLDVELKIDKCIFDLYQLSEVECDKIGFITIK